MPKIPSKKPLTVKKQLEEGRMTLEDQMLALDREMGELSEGSKKVLRERAGKFAKLSEDEAGKAELRRTVAKLASVLQSALGLDPAKRKRGISF